MSFYFVTHSTVIPSRFAASRDYRYRYPCFIMNAQVVPLEKKNVWRRGCRERTAHLYHIVTNPNRENHPARGCIGHQPDNPGEGWCRVKLPEEAVVPSEGQAVAVVLRQPPMYSRRNDVTLT